VTQPLFRIACDEAGRGSWAGPLIVGAVAVPLIGGTIPPEGLTDSKKLTPKRRENLVPLVQEWASAWGTGHATPYEIDQLGISLASRLAAHRALRALRLDFSLVDHILLDGNVNYISGDVPGKKPLDGIPPVRTLIKGDLLDPACSGASILAKVHHDNLITILAQVYPQYNWTKGMGYPTATHAALVQEHGLSNQHRRSWGVRNANGPSRK